MEKCVKKKPPITKQNQFKLLKKKERKGRRKEIEGGKEWKETSQG